MRPTILVTGGAGFIGSHICGYLLKNEYRVILLDAFGNSARLRRKEKNISQFKDHKRLIIADLNIADKAGLKKLFSRYKINKIIHLAGQSSVTDSFINPVKTFKINLIGGSEFFQIALLNGVNQIIVSSSSLVYGNGAKLPLKEDVAINHLTSPYAISLLSLEEMARIFSQKYKVRFTILRLFPVYGSRMRENLLIPVAISHLKAGLAIPLYGNPYLLRNYCHVNDAVRGLTKALDLNKMFEIINLGGSGNITNIELVNLIGGFMKKTTKVVYGKKRPDEISFLKPDLKKAKKLLNYSPKVNLKEGLKSYINWYLRNH